MTRIAAFAGALVAYAAWAQTPQSLPNPALTPGAVRSTSLAEICAPGYAREHRVWGEKRATLLKYGIPLSEARDYEDDDLVPVCVGGDNASPLNHWPQKRLEAVTKDDLEWRVCRAVCDGLLDLKTAQGWFLGDWRIHLNEVPLIPPIGH